MPFKVNFRIYDPGKSAPCLETTNRAYAYIEWKEKCSKAPLTRLVQEVTPVELTKPEKYVWLVYRVLKAIRKYYDERNHVPKEQSQENLKASLALEKELDLWNARTRFYLQGHPKSTPDDSMAFVFFEIVEVWRDKWHRYFAYKKQQGKDMCVEREMYKECVQIEKGIKEYVRKVIGL